MDSSLNIDTQPQPEQTGLSIDTGLNQAPVSVDTAQLRAAKIRFGLSGVLPDLSQQDLFRSLVSGQEQSVRNQAAANTDVQKASARQQKVQEIASLGDTQALKNTLAPIQPTNPTSVVEQGYGRSWIASLYDAGINLGDTDLHDAMRNAPDYIRNLANISEEAITKAEMVNTSLENIQDANQRQSTMGRAWNFLKGNFPFYSEIKLRGNAPGTGLLTGGFLGGNLQAQAAAYAAMPMAQFAQSYPQVIKYLMDSDPELAEQFAQAVHGLSTQKESLDNFFSASQFVPLGGGAAAVEGRVAKTAEEIMKDSVTAAFKHSDRDPGWVDWHAFQMGESQSPYALSQSVEVKAAASEAAGDIKSAAMERVAAEIPEDMKGDQHPIMRAIQGLQRWMRMDQTALDANQGSLAREQVQRIQDQFGGSIENLIDTVTNTMRTMRVNLQTASRITISAIQDDLKRRFPGWSNRVLDVTDPIYEPVSNTWFMGMNLGDQDGQLFAKETQARIAMNMLDAKDAEVRRQGAGYFIRVYKHLAEDTDPMRDLLVASDKDRSPGGWVNALIGGFRSAEDTMAETHTTARRGATYPMANFREMIAKDAKYISDLSQGNLRVNAAGDAINPLSMKFRAWGRSLSNREGWKEWKRALDATRDLPDPDDPTKKGVTFKTVGDWEQHFFSTVKRMPTYQETEAYFAKNRLDLFDHTLRNMAMYTNKASHGAESIKLFGISDKGLVRSEAFDAVPLKEIPTGGNFGFLYQAGDGLDFEIKKNWGELSPFHTGDDNLQDLVKQGRIKAYRVWAPEHNPLKGFGNVQGDERITYVLAKHVESSQLSWDQVPRRGGGHFDYDYNHYIKQAKLRRWGGEVWYEGDNTIMPIQVRRMGQDIVQKMNTARVLLMHGDEDAAKRYVENNLPMKWQDFRGWFKSGTSEPPMLDLEEPIQLVPKDTSIINYDSGLAKRFKQGSFRNGTREGSLNQQFAVNYTGERDARGLYTFNDIGTRNNPIYQVADAEKIDPIVSMNRALNNIVHTTFMNDYKKYAVHHWLQEIYKANWMDPDVAKEIRSAPFYWFQNPEKVFSKGVPIDFKNNMMSNYQKIQYFIGQPSKFDQYLHALEQHLMDVTYDALGPKSASVPIWLIGKVKDPVQFMRKMAYHAYLGLFNPAQWLVQNQTWTNIYAISPKSAPLGSVGVMLHKWAKYNRDPAILSALDKKAQAMGWRPGEWLEAMQTLDKTGFEHVEGEHAYLDTPMDYQFIGGDMRNFLDMGQFFFKNGVKNVRQGAWYTAFREYRNLHPTGKLNETDIQNILNTADRYHANMSRASVSNIQHGLMSVPLQFLTYQMRLAELFMGKRLGDTVQERMMARGRLLGVYSAMYGVPLSVGLTGLPLGDNFRKAALDNGYVVGDKWYTTAFNEGLPSMFMGMATGNYYDIGDRFGAKGFDFLKNFAQVFNSDQSAQEAMGAAFNLAVPTMSAFGHLLWAHLNQSGYEPTISDWVDIAKEVTSARQAWKFYTAARFGEWLTKNEQIAKDNVSLSNAAWMSLTGLQPQAESDTFLKGQIIHDRGQQYQEWSKNYAREISRGVRAAKDGNDTLANSFFSRASIWLNLLPVTERHSAVNKARAANWDQSQKIDWTFHIKMAPPGTEQQNLEAYQRQQQLNQGQQ